MLFRIAAFVWVALPAPAQTYFPTDVLPNEAAQKYTRFLRAMHEPSLPDLANRDPQAVVYRLLLLRDHDRPVSIRFMVRPGGTAWFYRRVTGGTGFTGPAGLRDSGMSFSWKGRTASFLKMVDDSGFWSFSNAGPQSGGVCSSHWILEGVRQGSYHVVDRCSPGVNDPVRSIGMRAMKLASLRLHGSQVY